MTHFKRQDDVEDEACSGRPSTSTCGEKVHLVCVLTEEDQRQQEPQPVFRGLSTGSAYTTVIEKVKLPEPLLPGQLQARAELSDQTVNKWDRDPKAFPEDLWQEWHMALPA